MTTAYIIFKERYDRTTYSQPIDFRIVEGHIDYDRAMNSIKASKAALSTQERKAGWEYNYYPVEIVDLSIESLQKLQPPS